jgi:beta-N-acetylhexosaminidase
LDIVNGAEPRALADEIAARSITLVRDDTRQLPLRPAADARIAVVVPVPRDLTPADTSSYEKPALANALREYFAHVDEFSVKIKPSEADVATLRYSLADYDVVIVGTINATTHLGQASLVNALLHAHIKTIVVALRMPYDLQAFPHAPTFLCAYSLLPPSMRALARILVGEKASEGKLPVSIPGLYPIGHRM